MVLGRTDNDLCPVSALLTYLLKRGNTPGALFQWENRIPLSKTKFVEAIRRALTAANLPAKDYAGHSFRIGAATTAASAGLEDSDPGTVEKCLFPTLHPNQPSTISRSVKNFIKMHHIAIVDICTTNYNILYACMYVCR